MNKDESIDRLLRRTAGTPANAEPSRACLDAETLAAWMDGSLSRAQRSAAEVHAADCNRCLATLSVLARTAPPPSDALRPLWLSFRWLVPLTTAAVAIVAWMLIQPLSTPVEQRSKRAAATAETPEKRRDQATAETQENHSDQATAETQEKHREAKGALAARKPQSGDAVNKTLGERDARRPAASPRQTEPATAVDAVRPAPPSKPLARAEAANERRQVGAALASAAEIRSPDPNVRWRLAGASVERSIDGGRTWTAQPMPTRGELRAGASPARDVCWVVGRQGLVLLSTDGVSWRRLDFPDGTADLTAVAAVDASTATVTAADGRTYRTIDAGRTWTLQETPAAAF